MTRAGDVTPPPSDLDGAAAGEPKAVVLAIQEAFRKADYARMAALYDDDVDWLFNGPPEVFPQIGHRRGKIAVFKAFADLNAAYRFNYHVSDMVIADGEWVAGIADVTMVQRATGRTIRCRIASFHRVSNGCVVSYRGFVDSLDAAEQVLGKIIEV